jgi:hypothetical protein
MRVYVTPKSLIGEIEKLMGDSVNVYDAYTTVNTLESRCEDDTNGVTIAAAIIGNPRRHSMC